MYIGACESSPDVSASFARSSSVSSPVLTLLLSTNASLTSFPQRMYEIHYTLYSLLTQTIKPAKVILWLGREQFPNLEKDNVLVTLDCKLNDKIYS